MKVLLVVAWAALVSLAGCASAPRAVVDPAALEAASLDWTATEFPAAGGKLGGASVVETAYEHRAASSPPYSGTLQVFTLNGDTRSVSAVLAAARQLVHNVSADAGITLDANEAAGSRTLASGIATQFVALEGTVAGTGGLFPRDATVRLLAEAGAAPDGTRIVAIALAQVGTTTSCPVVGPCGSSSDPRTWNEIVGDANGSVEGAHSEHGLVDHVVLHG